MKLLDLLNKANLKSCAHDDILQQQVTDIVSSSHNIKQNSIFIARKGGRYDGHNFVEQAIKKGSILAIVEKGSEITNHPNIVKLIKCCKVIAVDNTKEVIIKLCKVFYVDIPENIFMITGTNGKTSVACFISQLLSVNKVNNATIGTLGVFLNGKKSLDIQTNLTTPDVTDLFKTLWLIKKQNINYVVIEASSEGIKEGRLSGIHCNAAIFTNLTQEHLNYHKTMEEYFSAKASLFLGRKPDFLAVINKDDIYGEQLIKLCQEKSIKYVDYGEKAESLTILNVDALAEGYKVKFTYKNKDYNTSINIYGAFQVYNIMSAILLLVENNYLQLEDVVKHIPKLISAQGRMQKVCDYKGGQVFVDYAHTPNALEEALKSLKSIVKGRILVLFGCGGERDKEKRPLMGDVAANLADILYITDDNPRNENPESIREEIIYNFNNKNIIYYNIAGREQAITLAMNDLQKNDVLLIAGKGHENFQIIGNTKIAFNDAEIAFKVSQYYS